MISASVSNFLYKLMVSAKVSSTLYEWYPQRFQIVCTVSLDRQMFLVV